MNPTAMRLSRAVVSAGLLAFGVCADASHADPLYTPEDTHQAIRQAADEFGVSELLLARIVDCEDSTFDPYAIGLQGELGPAQLHPKGLLPTFYAVGYLDPFSPYQAIRFLAQEITFGKGSAWSCW